jgi:tRNA modification GTPase
LGADKNSILSHTSNIIRFSTRTGEGLPELEELIKELYNFGKYQGENGELITSVRHKNSLVKAEGFLKNSLSALNNNMTFDALTEDISDAIAALGEITGETVNEGIVKAIFKNFCVGK